MVRQPEHDFSQIIPATIGALSLYYEAQLILSGKKDENKAEAAQIASDMAQVITQSFLAYHAIGETSSFFGLVPFPINSSPTFLESPMIPPELVFQALQEGYLMLEQIQSKELEGQSIFIATVGRNNSGKGVVTEYLREKYGFLAYPLSVRVREMASAFQNNPPHDREILIEVGRTVKQIFGAGVLISAAINLFSEFGRQNRLLFDGLRVPGEATRLLEMSEEGKRVMIIAITTGGADFESERHIRFERALGRGGPKDPKEDTAEAYRVFCELDAVEGPGIQAAMDHATHVIVNSGEIELVYDQIDSIMSEVGIDPVVSK